MIIQNGTIEIKMKTGGGIDPATGFPVRPAEEWGAPIPCQFYANRRNNLGRSNGEHFTVASYIILIEFLSFEGEEIRLSDRTGRTVGEYSVMSAEPLDAVSQTMITV